jgi:hypothetical protein
VANVAVVLLVLLLAWGVVSILRRNRRGIVAERGMSIGADLGALADQPRVRVRAVTQEGADRVRLVLTPEAGPIDGSGPGTSPDLDLVVFLSEGDFGLRLLHEWEQTQGLVALVEPPGGRIVRLRSMADLQPLTLRRVDDD